MYMMVNFSPSCKKMAGKKFTNIFSTCFTREIISLYCSYLSLFNELYFLQIKVLLFHVINNKAPTFTIPVINIEVNNGYNWSG